MTRPSEGFKLLLAIVILPTIVFQSVHTHERVRKLPRIPTPIILPDTHAASQPANVRGRSGQ